MKKLATKTNQTPPNTTQKKKVKAPEVSYTSKKEQVIDLLKKSDGLDIPELIKITGWQAHSVRGFISGTLKKKLNLNVISEIGSSGSRKYKIATEA